MKRNHLLIAVACFSAMVLVTACTQKFPGYKKTQSGLYYKFHSLNASAPQPKLTDFLKVEMACYLHDSLYYDWEGTQKDVYSQLKKPIFKGDLQEAYAMMHIGDSASFYVKADSVAKLYYNQDPNVVGLKPDDYFRYEIKLLEVKSEEEFRAEIERMKETMRTDSEKAFFEYLKANNITDYTASGLFFSKSVVTKGVKPQKGQMARIKFVASFLDGTVFGNSDQLGEHYDVEVGEGKVLKGLDEGIGMMRVGEKARFVLPYTLAYGSNPYGFIPAYSNLVFDVELLDVFDKEITNNQ